MGRTPHAFVSYTPSPKYDFARAMWLSHEHMVPLGDGRLVVLDTEEAAEELAEAVRHCSQDKHDGKGYDHTDEEAEEAFRVACIQIAATDFEAVWAEAQRKIRVFQRWGGNPPAAMFMPDPTDPKKWNLMMPDRDGMPYFYVVKNKVLDDIIPPPNEKTAFRDKQGITWRTKKRHRRRNGNSK